MITLYTYCRTNEGQLAFSGLFYSIVEAGDGTPSIVEKRHFRIDFDKLGTDVNGPIDGLNGNLRIDRFN